MISLAETTRLATLKTSSSSNGATKTWGGGGGSIFLVLATGSEMANSKLLFSEAFSVVNSQTRPSFVDLYRLSTSWPQLQTLGRFAGGMEYHRLASRSKNLNVSKKIGLQKA